ncbi:hypothetical protein [Helicobacter heilmannii]|uniref:hypothetical protein n=1 Tax=Helicobacter heilmannii TaxID=35817 RepID=UPI0006B30B06|nr:hypothetical protein [Helicobacter heilmannii]GMB94252.1 hypothetical protein NHP21011_03430 [Helicobacter heilmannii]
MQDNPNFHVNIVTLKDAFMEGERAKTGFENLCNKTNIELKTLFTQEDREKFSFKNTKKPQISSAVSSHFKNTSRIARLATHRRDNQESKRALFDFLESRLTGL